MSRTRAGTVKETGARANDLLIGDEPSNLGLEICVYEAQEPSGQRVQGTFKLLNAGTGKYSEYLKENEGRNVDADELVSYICKKEGKGKRIIHIFNRNMLRLNRKPVK